MRRRLMGWCLLLILWSAPCEGKQWRTYENCTLIANESNDGDSFHVRYNKRHYLFRLYFVDTPESEDSLPERVTEQAAYWGIDPKTSVQLGKEAAKFTAKFLADGFTVHSKLSDAMGRSDKDRDYAVVMKGDKDLAVELVRNGYARVFGTGVDYPDGTPEKSIWWRLKTAEGEAQKNKAGGWGRAAPVGNRFEQLNPALAAKPSVPSAAPTAPPAPALILERDLTLSRAVSVYSLQDPGRKIGYLQAGAEVTVMRAESDAMVRIRFSTKDGKTYEAQSPRVELGL
ncbi:MAG: thermonuclease family protein [Lentisphaerota bacterium]